MGDSTIGIPPIGTESITSTVVRRAPVVVVSAPSGTILDSQATAEWTVTDSVRPIVACRLRLESQAGTALFDTGTINSWPVTSQLIPVNLTSFSGYTVVVEAFDGMDWGEGSSSFFVGATAAVEATSTEVGTVYEVGIDGQGFMLQDSPERPYQRQVGQLTPERLATGQTPFAEAVDRYSFVEWSDFSGGRTQRYGSNPKSDPTKFFESEGVDPFEPGELRLLHDTFLVDEDTYADQQVVVASDTAYVLTGTTSLAAYAAPEGAPTVFTASGGAGTGQWLASDGQYWYLSNGTAIRRNNTAVDPAVDWSTVDVEEIAWCSDRLAGLDRAAATPNVTTFAPDGTEEVADGRFVFSAGTELAGLCGGDGYLWFGVNRGPAGGAEVRAWKIGSADEDFVALNLPLGEAVTSLFFYLGNVFIATVNADDTNTLYRALPQEGMLQAEAFATLEGAGTVRWAGANSKVAFTWDGMQDDDKSGIGVYDLAFGGYAKWFAADVAGVVGGVVRWAGDFAFTINETGLFTPQRVLPADRRFVTSGWLSTSSVDLSSSLAKEIDEITMRTRPLTGGASTEVTYSADALESFVPGSSTLVGDGAQVFEMKVGVPASEIGLRVTLYAGTSGVTSPALRSVALKVHPTGLRDELIQIPVLCADEALGLNKVPLPDNGDRQGQRLARFLESRVGAGVLFQDIDWPLTSEARRVELVSVTTTAVGVFDRQKGRRSDEYVCVVTLRRPV